MELELEFIDCEHDGDLAGHLQDITSSGGKIVSTFLNDSCERATVVVEVKNERKFWKKFNETDASGFLN